MWKAITNNFDDDTSVIAKKMRYFILYPPKNIIRLIDVSEKNRVDEVLSLAKKEFGLKVDGRGKLAQKSIVLNYNGFDLKPKWILADLNIPSGAIIRCINREEKAPHLYVYCGYNKQILKLFDSSINNDTTIGTIRKKISNQLGLPLSVFCLETYDGKQRLFDEMTLMNYEIKVHDRIFLKVWKGYEKFINSCIKGFPDEYSRDDLTRYYQLQVALHIAAFYGHMELASYVMQHGARTDRPVDEHPCRLWTSETAKSYFPEMYKCPLHIAIERGQVKMVDLFVRQSILCSQTREPLTGYLPYRYALHCSMLSTAHDEKQRSHEIYFYLHNKQYNFRVPLNANGEYVTKLLTSTTTASSIHLPSKHFVYVSLPLYCRIISWYERARERAWKKFGGNFSSTSQGKRVYPRNGLLGYKVLIDGYNNKFEVPKEPSRAINMNNTLRFEKRDHPTTLSKDDYEKVEQMKKLMKQISFDEHQYSRKIGSKLAQTSRRTPLVVPRTTNDLNKNSRKIGQTTEVMSSLSDFSNSHILSNISGIDFKKAQMGSDIDRLSNTNLVPPTSANSVRIDDKRNQADKLNRSTQSLHSRSFNTPRKSMPSAPPDAHATQKKLTNRFETVAKANRPSFHSVISSADAYLLVANRLADQTQQHREAKKQQLYKDVELFLQKEQKLVQNPDELANPSVISITNDRSSIFDADSYIPLPEHAANPCSSAVKSRVDLKIRQSTIAPYENYTKSSTRSTAINCLQEAGYFKGKSWLQQVEISKDMIKNKAQRNIRRGPDEINKAPKVIPIRENLSTTPSKRFRSINAN